MIRSVADMADELFEPDGYEHGLICDSSLENLRERMRFFRQHCESPIEYAFGVAFSDHERVETFEPDKAPKDFDDRTVVLIPQLVTLCYRLDFAVLFWVDGRIHKWAIECDGKEWHTSEQQIARDKRRDMDLLADGWRVLRYAGYLLHYGAGGMADRVHVEIDAFRSGQDESSIERYLDPKQWEEVGEVEAARWYRETRPLCYQRGDK